MVMSLKGVLLVIALVLFLLAAFFHWWRPSENRVNLTALGLFFFGARELVAD